MSPFVRVLSVILSASFLLTPFSTLHAHVTSDHHDSALHGGHVHHGDEHQSGQSDGAVFDVNFAVADRSSSAFNWTSWLPLVISLAALWLSFPYLTAVLRPPPLAPHRLPGRNHHWQPPLRGPPSFPINVR